MDQDVKARWVTALRSGAYTQCRRRLHTGDKFCCLGVLCAVEGLAQNSDDEYEYEGEFDRVALPSNFRTYMYITKDEEDSLIGLNDIQMKTFKEIADWIEEKL